jgi:lysozyme
MPIIALGCTATVNSDNAGQGEDAPATTSTSACAPKNTVLGVDVSDGQGTIDWASAAAGGVSFGIAKATQGTYNTQSGFADNWNGMIAAGVVPGAYHFFDPREDGVAQAQHFLSVVGPMSAGQLPPMLDIECPDGDSRCLGFSGGAGNEPGSTIHQRMMDFLSYVQTQTGRRPIIYTFGSYFADNAVSTSGLQSYPLDIAFPTTANCFHIPAPWTAATLWQNSWTGSIPGIPGQVDEDLFLGDTTSFEAFVGGTAGGSGSGTGSGTGSSGSGSGSDTGSNGSGSGSGGPVLNGCNSATLAAQVPSGTCVQAASDANWYTCDNGNWVDGEDNCTRSYAWCDSATLGRSVPPRTCVQSASDRIWYQCDSTGWDTPVHNGAGPIGACSTSHPL